MDKAIVLLSGGLDSTTCLALARQKKLEVFALSFDYGQKHIVELTAAKSIAKQYGVSKHYIVPIKIPDISTSSLTNKNSVVVNLSGSCLPSHSHSNCEGSSFNLP